jgi:hypothetical protein
MLEKNGPDNKTLEFFDTLTQYNTIESFFHDKIKKYRDLLNIEISEPSEHYVHSLLTEFSLQENFLEKGEDYKTLALEFTKAQKCQREDCFETYRKMGDYILFITGVFPEFVSKPITDTSSVNYNYYKLMGAYAYSKASKLNIPYNVGYFLDVFKEIAAKFDDILMIIDTIIAEGIRNRYGIKELITRFKVTKNPNYEMLAREIGVDGLFYNKFFYNKPIQ